VKPAGGARTWVRQAIPRDNQNARDKVMNRKICCLFATLGAIGRTLLPAQNPPVVEPPPSLWESSAFMGFTLTRGNSDTVLVTANVKTTKKEKENEWAFGADGSYGETDSVKNSETLHGYGQYNRLFSDRFFGYLRADALHDGIADLDYRFMISPGVGYYLIKEKATSLAVEAGPGYVIEKRGGIDDSYATLRLAERFEHKFSDRARVWQSVEYLPDLGDFPNYVINFEAGIAATIAKNLELSVVLQDNYVNQPAAGLHRNDVKLISGVTYKF
jgi:putative salt-induced outer membrane protein